MGRLSRNNNEEGGNFQLGGPTLSTAKIRNTKRVRQINTDIDQAVNEKTASRRNDGKEIRVPVPKTNLSFSFLRAAEDAVSGPFDQDVSASRQKGTTGGGLEGEAHVYSSPAKKGGRENRRKAINANSEPSHEKM